MTLSLPIRPLNPLMAEAVELSKEVEDITTAIRQGKEAYANERMLYPLNVTASADQKRQMRLEYYGTEYFRVLSERRGRIYRRINQIIAEGAELRTP